MDIHVRDLRYFVAVAEELGFTRAAERLHLSQPALSKQVRQLERHLHADLFVRERRGIRLTAAGRALLAHAGPVLEAWDAAVAAVGDAAAGDRQCLTVGIQTAVGRDLQRRTLAAFAERRPGWRVSLRLCSWADPTAGLAEGSSDVAFVWLPVPVGSSLTTTVLYEEDRWVALPDDHPLAARAQGAARAGSAGSGGEGHVTLADLLDEPFVALPAAAGTLRDYWLAVDERPPDRPPTVAAEAANAEEVFELIAAGVGVALLAAGNAAIYRRPGVCSVPVRGLQPSRLAIAHRSDDRRPAVHDLVAAATAAATGPR